MVPACGDIWVGMADAVLLAQHDEVVALDLDVDRVAMINRSEPTVDDDKLRRYLAVSSVSLSIAVM